MMDKEIKISDTKLEYKKNQLALTTLCKNDYTLFPIFYDHYTKQGVDHFYIYYNGIITNSIKEVFSKPNVTLIQWNFRYWNPPSCKFRHCAQMGQIHNALYKYGKNVYPYMIFCDLDEYMYIPKTTIKKYIFSTNKDCYVFHNRWCKTIDDVVPKILPNKFYSSINVEPVGKRSKCIYKTDSIETLSIHFYDKVKKNITIIKDLHLYHFHTWSGKRKKNLDTKYKLTYIS